MEFPILSTSNNNSTSNTRQSQHQFNLNSHSPMLAASSQPSSPNSSFSSNPHQPFFYPPPNPALFFHQQQQQWAAAAAAYHQQQLFFHQSQYFQPPYPDFSGRRRTSSGPQRPSSSHPYLDNRQHSYSQVASLNPRSLNNHRRSKSDALSKDDLLVKTSTKGARPNVNRTESSPLPNSVNNKKYQSVDHLDDLDDFSPPMPINNRIRTSSHSSNDSKSSKNSNNNSIRKDQQISQSTPSNQFSSQPNLSSNNKPSPLSQQPPLILNENKVNNVNSKNEKSGLKSKLKRALSNSSNNNLNNVNAIDDSSIGRNTNVKLHQPKQSSNSASNQNQQSQQSSPQLPVRTRTISESNKSKPVESSQENVNVEKPKKHSIFNSKFNVSTDNISISSAASSASVMLRKIGSVGKLARRSSFAGLTNLFNKDKERDRDSGGEEVDENGENKKGLGSKLKKKKRNKRKKEASLSVSHATAEVDRHSIIREEPENNNFNQDGLSPAAALVKQHQEQVAAAEARASINSNNINGSHSGSETNIKNMNNNASLTGSTNNHNNNYDKYNSNYNNDDESESIIYSDDDDDDRIINGIRSVEINDNTKFDLSEATHRREHFVKGILKGAGKYKQEDFEERPDYRFRGRSNSSSVINGIKHNSDDQFIDYNQPRISQIPSPNADIIDGVSTSRPQSMHKNNPNFTDENDNNNNDNDQQPKILPMQSSTILTINGNSPKRKCTFANSMAIHSTWASNIYDRRGEPATCNKLTPELAQMIKEEMNAFKMEEMRVHANSRLNTQFFL